MHRHQSWDHLQGEADAIDLEATRIEQALAAGRALNEVAQMALDRGAERVGPMIHEEELTLSAALREHDPNREAWAAEREARDCVMVDYERLQADMAEGRDVAEDLNTLASDLHRYAAIERHDIAALAESAGDEVLREADFRIAGYGKKANDFACDLDDAWK